MKTELIHSIFAECGFMYLRQIENSNMNEYCLWQTNFRREHIFLYDDESCRFILFKKHEKVCDCHINTISQFAQLVKIFWNLHVTINTMKSPEQKITDLEKRQEEITKEITELKKELNKSTTFEELKRKTTFEELDSFMMPLGMNNKVYAIRDVCVVADYLNDGWEFNPRAAIPIYGLCIGVDGRVYAVEVVCQLAVCYFKTLDSAKKAIQILGEEKIKLALS